ncbi:acyl-CoA synthetase family member 2, mitochondrial [Trichoplusia ni]|uniref:Medium-chain acyl-CoA ligase ACSF2, mitochondrial n=1 Tax=Trichoplusia ni TaxID=7111 RepID=A0A7E5VY74_TRINI|nr:acyl-CoA synthetase family member 2, mitochondrial [Trichoplusia ni]
MWNKYTLLAKRLNYIGINRWARQIQSVAGQSYLHNPGSEPLVDDTLGEILYQAANRHPDRIAVTSLHEDVSMTYGELLRQADSLGCALRAQGLEKGDRVGVWTHNNTAWIVAVVAAARAGLISVLINPVYEKSELSYCLNKTQIKSLLIGEGLPNRNYYGTLSQVIPEIQNSSPGSLKSAKVPSLTSIITAGSHKLAGAIRLDSLTGGSGSQISRYGSEVKSSDGCIIHFTSGTTGDPKAALDSHKGVVNNTYFIGKRMTFHEGRHNICVQVPLFHALGSVATVHAGLRHGCTLVLPSPTYDINANIKAMFSEKCTVITGTPTMFVDMLAKVKTMGEVPSKLRVALAAGAPCSPQLIRDLEKYLKTESVKGLYGMTETTASVFQSIAGDSTDLVAETVGYIQDHVEVKVVDEDNNMVPFGSPGELVVRGYNTMICYWDEPEKTRQTISEDGWLKTGDKFTISEDGYGRIVGRLKDIIIRGGENIAPKEIEDLLNTHPDIIESQVIGVPDERLGEDLCAVLRVKEGATVTVEDIKNLCTGQLARFKIPRQLKITQEFPKTASGKIQKYQLRNLVVSGKL